MGFHISHIYDEGYINIDSKFIRSAWLEITIGDVKALHVGTCSRNDRCVVRLF